ncbi:hypothetical protein AVEN_170868-1, partial [Araneus ventricosus]
KNKVPRFPEWLKYLQGTVGIRSKAIHNKSNVRPNVNTMGEVKIAPGGRIEEKRRSRDRRRTPWTRNSRFCFVIQEIVWHLRAVTDAYKSLTVNQWAVTDGCVNAKNKSSRCVINW